MGTRARGLQQALVVAARTPSVHCFIIFFYNWPLQARDIKATMQNHKTRIKDGGGEHPRPASLRRRHARLYVPLREAVQLPFLLFIVVLCFVPDLSESRAQH